MKMQKKVKSLNLTNVDLINLIKRELESFLAHVGAF